ncbi:unnamed protein product [Timema podura]|uniref:Uncharacterized protein n=1 Tax=Timema podura TaxID=61482 RepID=A0ABN7P835_TIMPD|nr:unnamed protein product [Timema podura]
MTPGHKEELTVPFPRSRAEIGKTVTFAEPAQEGVTATPKVSALATRGTSPTIEMETENLIKAIELITAQRDRCLASRAIDLETIDSQKKQMAAMREQMNQLSETNHGRAIKTHLQKGREYMSALEEKDALVAIKLSEEEINLLKTKLKSKDSIIAQLREKLMSSVDKSEHDKAITSHRKEIDRIKAFLSRKEQLSQTPIETTGDTRVQTREPVNRDPKRDQLDCQNLETGMLCSSNKQSADKQPCLCECENCEVCPKKLNYKINDIAGTKRFGKGEEKNYPNLEHGATIDNKEHNVYSDVHLLNARRVQKHLAETIIELARQRDESVSTLKSKQAIIDSLTEKIDKKQSDVKSSISQQEIDSDLKKSQNEIDNYLNLELSTSKKTYTLSEASDSIRNSSYTLSEASDSIQNSSYALSEASDSILNSSYALSEASDSIQNSSYALSEARKQVTLETLTIQVNHQPKKRLG